MLEVTQKARELIRERGLPGDQYVTIRDALVQAAMIYCDAHENEVVFQKRILFFKLSITWGDMRNVIVALFG